MRIGFTLSSFFCTPYTDRSDFEWHVFPSGDVYYFGSFNVDNSYGLRTLDTRHFGGWIYLVHLIVIYTMMYLIPTEIIFARRARMVLVQFG